MNKLKLNPDKSEVLLVSQKADQGIGMQPMLDGVALLLKPKVLSLQVLLDWSLTLYGHALAVARSTFTQFTVVHQLCMLLERSHLAMVDLSLIHI